MAKTPPPHSLVVLRPCRLRPQKSETASSSLCHVALICVIIADDLKSIVLTPLETPSLCLKAVDFHAGVHPIQSIFSADAFFPLSFRASRWPNLSFDASRYWLIVEGRAPRTQDLFPHSFPSLFCHLFRRHFLLLVRLHSTRNVSGLSRTLGQPSLRCDDRARSLSLRELFNESSSLAFPSSQIA